MLEVVFPSGVVMNLLHGRRSDAGRPQSSSRANMDVDKVVFRVQRFPPKSAHLVIKPPPKHI